MDYFQGVVIEYLRADRSCFVNPEFWIRGNVEHPHERPHWFVDVLAVSMRDKAVYLCEVTYAKQPRALARRLHSWKEHWSIINHTLRQDAHIAEEWPLIPWVFAPSATLPVILDEADWPKWLGEEPATLDELYALLKHCPDEALKAWPVDKSVGNVKNKGPQLVTPIDPSVFGETV